LQKKEQGAFALLVAYFCPYPRFLLVLIEVAAVYRAKDLLRSQDLDRMMEPVLCAGSSIARM